MRRLLTCLFLAIVGLSVGQLAAQIVSYSQPMELPVFINPASVGNAGAIRFGAFYHNQWLNASSPYNTYGISFDRPFGVYYNHAIGGTLTNDAQGSNVIQYTALNIAYAYMFDLTYDFRIRLGLQAGAIMKSANYNKLVFPDMLNDELPVPNRLNYDNSHRFTYDIGFGAIGEYQMWEFGLTVDHIPEPKFDTRALAEYSRIPRKYSLYASMRINVFELYRFKTPLYIVPMLYTSYQARDISSFAVGTRALEVMAGLRVEYIGIFGALYYRNSIFYPKQSISASVGYAGDWFAISYGYNMGFMDKAFRGLEASEHEVTLGIKFPLKRRSGLASTFNKKKRMKYTKYSRKRAGASRTRRRR